MVDKVENSHDLDAAYAEMARDEEREAEALEWVEAMLCDVDIDSDDFVYEKSESMNGCNRVRLQFSSHTQVRLCSR